MIYFLFIYEVSGNFIFILRNGRVVGVGGGDIVIWMFKSWNIYGIVGRYYIVREKRVVENYLGFVFSFWKAVFKIWYF